MHIKLLNDLLTFKIGVVSFRCNKNISDVQFRNFKVKFYQREKILNDNEVSISNAAGIVRVWLDLNNIIYREGKFSISFDYKEEGMEEFKTYKAKIKYEPFSLPKPKGKRGSKK